MWKNMKFSAWRGILYTPHDILGEICYFYTCRGISDFCGEIWNFAKCFSTWQMWRKLKFTQFCCNLPCFVAIYVLLHGEKSSRNCVCGEMKCGILAQNACSPRTVCVHIKVWFCVCFKVILSLCWVAPSSRLPSQSSNSKVRIAGAPCSSWWPV